MRRRIRNARGGSVRLRVMVLGAACCVALGCSSEPAIEVREAELPELAEIRQTLRDAGYAEAEKRARELLPEYETTYGADSPEVARTLDLLVESLWRASRDRTPDARALAERAVVIKRKRFGGDAPETADSLRNQAIVLEDNGEPGQAEPLYEQIVAIRKRGGDATASRYASALIDLAIFYEYQSRFDESKTSYLEALAVQEKTVGRDHIDAALTLNNLAGLHRRLGEYEAARDAFEEAMAIYRRELGEDDLDLMWTVSGLAAVYQELGDYAKAEELENQVLGVRREKLPPDHVQLTWSLNNLAYYSKLQGRYGRSRDLYEQTLDIQKRTLSADHPTVAVTLSNLGELLYLTGDDAAALSMYEEALAIRRKALDPDHPHTATLLDKMSSVLARMGDLERARRVAEESFEIRERKFGVDHIETATSLAHLARIHELDGETAQARRTYERTIGILERIAAEHPLLAETLQGRSHLLLASGEAASASLGFEQALEIRERALGEGHPLVGETLLGLALAEAASGDTAEALDHALRCERIGRDHLKLTARTLSERQALAYASVRPSGLDPALVLVTKNPKPEGIRDVWNALIHSRAMVLDEMARRRHVRAAGPDAETERLWDDLRSAGTRLANLMVRGPDPERAETYTALLRAAREEHDRAERALAQVLADDPAAALERAGLDEVARALPERTALVAFVRYAEPPILDGASAGDSEPHAFAAFVLARGSGSPRAPAMIRLADANTVDRRVAAWKREAARVPPASRQGRTDAERKYRTVGTALREAVWDPLAEALGDAERVLVVPDGELNLVNFSALPAAGDAYLVTEGPSVHYLSAERDVVLRPKPSRERGDLLVLGGPAFDAETGGKRDASTFRGGRSSCRDFASIRFEPLPQTVREVRQIAGLWRDPDAAASDTRHGVEAGDPTVTLLEGLRATEAAFKANASGKQVLHLATHGFFLGVGCPTALDGSRGVGGLVPADPASVGKKTENPLLLSGLVLAGANLRNDAAADQEDGILTAEEVASLDLSRTEWAVLSACDTGVGVVRSGEGVFGLRRAFQVAGADTVIMSLWSVSDRAARAWMDELYRARSERGMATIDAVRTASARVMETHAREAGTRHPFFWAGFVAAGDWR